MALFLTICALLLLVGLIHSNGLTIIAAFVVLAHKILDTHLLKRPEQYAPAFEAFCNVVNNVGGKLPPVTGVTVH